MRSISATLETAQSSGAADPYIYLEISGTSYTSRLIALEHVEEPYKESAIIVLANSDRYFDSNSLLGKGFSIGYGYVTGSGIEYCGDGTSEGTPRLWVKTQSMTSIEGSCVCILECEGAWAKLRENTFIAVASGEQEPYFNIAFTSTDTVYQLVEKILTEMGFTLSAESVDSIIQTFKPVFKVNPNVFENAAYIVKALMDMTNCYLRQRPSLDFKVVYPQTTDAVQETYYSYQAPYYKEFTERTKLLIPNSIVVFCNYDYETESWNPDMMFSGTAKDDPSIALYGEVIEYFIAPTISTQADANNRAQSLLTKYKAEMLSGRLVLPFHDCRLELYDKVSIWDIRGF